MFDFVVPRSVSQTSTVPAFLATATASLQPAAKKDAFQSEQLAVPLALALIGAIVLLVLAMSFCARWRKQSRDEPRLPMFYIAARSSTSGQDGPAFVFVRGAKLANTSLSGSSSVERQGKRGHKLLDARDWPQGEEASLQDISFPSSSSIVAERKVTVVDVEWRRSTDVLLDTAHVATDADDDDVFEEVDLGTVNMAAPLEAWWAVTR